MARSTSSRVHPTAVVDPRAELADDVEVGAFAIVGPGVRIDRGSRLLSHVVIGGGAIIGEGNVFHPFSVIGGDPQIRKLAPGQTDGDGDGEGEGEGDDGGGLDVASIIAWVLAAAFVVCGIVGLVTILRWMATG